MTHDLVRQVCEAVEGSETGRELLRQAVASLRGPLLQPPPELLVMGDWLEERGIAVPWTVLVSVLPQVRFYRFAERASEAAGKLLAEAARSYWGTPRGTSFTARRRR